MVGRYPGASCRLLIGVLLAVPLIGILPVAAEAHAVLLETTPAAGAAVSSPPEAIVLRFNEPVRPIVVQVLRAGDSTVVGLPAAEAIDTLVRLPLPQGLPDGSYVLSYRVTSADGHPVAGSFVFSVGAAATAAAANVSVVDPYEAAWRWLGVAARSLWYGILLLAAGRALFLALIPAPPDLAPRLEHGLVWLATAGIGSGLLLLAAEGGALLGGPPGSLLSAEVWRLAIGSSVAWTVAAGVAGLALLIPARPRRSLLLAGAVLVALSFGLSGHAATAGPRWLTVPVLALHALSAAFWVGALWPLLLILRRGGAKMSVEAFSALALPAVACLLLAGAVLAVLQLDAWSALFTTDYGRRLTLKLVLVAGLLGLAAVNRLVLTPALDRREHVAARWLRRTIGVDLALAAGVIVLTASLGAVPPPRALALQAAADGNQARRDYAVVVTAPGHQLVLVVTPALAGDNRLDLYVTDEQDRPTMAKDAEVALSLPERGIEPLRVAATLIEPGHYRAQAFLPLAGAWRVRADLLIDDFTELPFQARIVVAR